MHPVPIPAHIHYELLLQLLERQTLNAINREQRDQIQSIIILLRKAAATQKQVEQHLANQGIDVSYRWSLNQPEVSELDLPTKT
ncbi:MAG: DUF5340 family protein [Pseudanabaenaceae cyanobacterium bins.68]|nr:DUF5340 family protein [Pseudanabaenaceae cyanobacterium bins.68]